jgi:excisionase family DNA binding protein
MLTARQGSGRLGYPVEHGTKGGCMDNRLLTLKQAAELANVSRCSIYRMVRDGRIPSIRFGKLYRIRPESMGFTFRKEECIPVPDDPPKTAEKPREETFLDRLRPELEWALESFYMIHGLCGLSIRLR